jgi:hypothetical protein
VLKIKKNCKINYAFLKFSFEICDRDESHKIFNITDLFELLSELSMQQESCSIPQSI